MDTNSQARKHGLVPLPRLAPTTGQVDVQGTAFSTDALGRFVANTYEEATASGPFSAIVVGAGAYGTYCATEIRRSHPGARVLLLDAGSFLVHEHVQNLGDIGLGVPAPIMPSADPGTPREIVWGLPWRGNVEFPGLAYCTGGKSIYWGGWCPRLTSGRPGRLAVDRRDLAGGQLLHGRERDRRRPRYGLHLRRPPGGLVPRGNRGRGDCARPHRRAASTAGRAGQPTGVGAVRL